MKQKEINLHIADLAPLSVAVTDTEESSWKNASALVDQLWQSWSRRFPNKPSKEILAMIALRFAQAFVVNGSAEKEIRSLLDDFEQQLDRLLVNDITDPTDGEKI